MIGRNPYREAFVIDVALTVVQAGCGTVSATRIKAGREGAVRHSDAVAGGCGTVSATRIKGGRTGRAKGDAA
ncbi:MAG TPA: hypothetical protein VFC19_41910 [Candidatus Limnocylindrales bacterium]|nr:hypothetical protein [Candidatus Limnocylindrales bacterium]